MKDWILWLLFDVPSFTLGILILILRTIWWVISEDSWIKLSFFNAYFWSCLLVCFGHSATSHFYGEEVAAGYFGIPIGILFTIFFIMLFTQSSSDDGRNTVTTPQSSSHYEPTMKQKQLDEMEKLTEVSGKQLEQVEKLRKKVEDLKWELEQERRYRNH